MPTVNAAQDIVQITSELVGSNPQGTSFAVPAVIAQFTSVAWGSDRARTYSGTRAAVLADLEADGIAEGSAVWISVSQMLLQKSAPSSVVVGRRDPSDLTWDAALEAIRAEDSSWYACYFPGVNTVSPIVEVATWCTQSGEMVLGFCSTVDADVYADASGNLSETLGALVTADNAGRFVLVYHDPQTASGAAAPIVEIAIPSAGTFDLTPGGTLTLRVDEGAEQVFALTAARAVVTGSNTETFALANAQHLDLDFDGVGSTLVATISATEATVSTGAETFDLSGAIGGTVEVVTDSGTDSYVLAAGVAPDLPTPATTSAAELAANFNGYITGTVADASAAGGVVTFASITGGTSARFRFTATTPASFLTALGLNTNEVAGSGNVADVSAVTADEVVAIVSSAIGSAGTASNSSGALRLQGNIYGTDGEVEIINTSTAGLLTALGLSAGVTAGTGSVGNAAAITPAALSTLLDTAFATGVTTTLGSESIDIESTTGVGYYYTLRFTGTLRSELGIETGLIRGAGVEDDHAAAAWIGARAGIDIDTRGLTKWDGAFLNNCYGDTIPLNVSQRLREDQNVNTIEVRSRNDPRPQAKDGRLVAGLSPTGEPVYIDSRIGIDWLAVRLQEAFLDAFDQLDNAGTAVLYNDRDSRAFCATVAGGVGAAAVRARVLDSFDGTPPDPSTGKVYGLDISFLADLSAADRNLRKWRLTSTQPGSAFLQRLSVRNLVGNA